MWRGLKPVSEQDMRDFESAFQFHFAVPLRGFLLEHNAGIPLHGDFPVKSKQRRISYLLDIADRNTNLGAWAVNNRVGKKTGPKTIVIGVDTLGNFVCVQRHYRQQSIVLWNHLTGEFEESLWDMQTFLRNMA